MTSAAPTGLGPVIQGWCPGALRPMQSGDGWVVRIRPRAGRLSAAQAHGIAELAQRFGNGLIDLSARANVQLRGVSMASHTPLIAGLGDLNLLDTDAEAEAQRNVILAPFWDAEDGAYDMALALSQALTHPSAPRLSSKFGFAVDIGASPVLRAAASDIRIERAENLALVYGQGAPTGALVAWDRAVDAAMTLAAWFASANGIGPDGRGRMAQFLSRGAVLPASFSAYRVPAAAPYRPKVGLCDEGVLAAFEFGQIDAQTLAALAAFGALRITPWRMVLIEGARQIPDIAELICAPDNPMLRVVACTGAPGCLQAHQDTRSLARRLAPDVAQGQTLHVSGCAKGCAHPYRADLTLTATANGFDLVHAGMAGDTPAQTQLSPDQIVQALNAP